MTPTSPLVILHVDTATEWRGGQRQLELLCRGLAARGHRQAVFCPPGSPMSARLPEGVQAADALPGNHPSNVPRLRAAARALGAQVIAAHTSHAHGLGLFAGPPLVVHRRVDFPPRGGPLNRWKYRSPAAYACVSRAVADVLVAAGAPPERLHVVPDGVDPPAAAAPADLGPSPAVLAVGALVDHKDHATLAAAAEGLAARVFVAGEGPLRPQLEGSALTLLGQRDDVPALYARADVFVHSSKEEGFGQSVIEAMMAGVPVVATAAGGVPEAVGDAGLLVPPRDPDALRAALVRALAGEHPPVEAARQRAMERFSVDRMVALTEDVYRSVIA